MAERHPAYDGFISIHALREEGDCGSDSRSTVDAYFNPRPPRGERLGTHTARKIAAVISIHALREESDSRRSDFSFRLWYFNPRPPRGERRCQDET